MHIKTLYGYFIKTLHGYFICTLGEQRSSANWNLNCVTVNISWIYIHVIIREIILLKFIGSLKNFDIQCKNGVPLTLGCAVKMILVQVWIGTAVLWNCMIIAGKKYIVWTQKIWTNLIFRTSIGRLEHKTLHEKYQYKGCVALHSYHNWTNYNPTCYTVLHLIVIIRG